MFRGRTRRLECIADRHKRSRRAILTINPIVDTHTSASDLEVWWSACRHRVSPVEVVCLSVQQTYSLAFQYLYLVWTRWNTRLSAGSHEIVGVPQNSPIRGHATQLTTAHK